MKTFGYALCSPIISYSFEMIRHYEQMLSEFDIFVFAIYLSLMFFGVAAIISGMLLLDLRAEKRSGGSLYVFE